MNEDTIQRHPGGICVRPWDLKVLALFSARRTHDVALTVALSRMLAIPKIESTLKLATKSVKQTRSEEPTLQQSKDLHRCCCAVSIVEPSPLREMKSIWQVATCSADGPCPLLGKLRLSSSATLMSQFSAAASYVGNLQLLSLHFPASWRFDPTAAMMGAVAGQQLHVLRWLFNTHSLALKEASISEPQTTYVLKALKKLPLDLAAEGGAATLRCCLDFGSPGQLPNMIPPKGASGRFESPLRTAALRGDVAALRIWLERGGFDLKEEHHSSALLAAIRAKEYRALCTLLLDAGADPHLRCEKTCVMELLIAEGDCERLEWWIDTLVHRKAVTTLPLQISLPVSCWEKLSNYARTHPAFFQMVLGSPPKPLVSIQPPSDLASLHRLALDQSIHWLCAAKGEKEFETHESATMSMRHREKALLPVPPRQQEEHTSELHTDGHSPLPPFLQWYLSQGIQLDIHQPNQDHEKVQPQPAAGDKSVPLSAICYCLNTVGSSVSAGEVKNCVDRLLRIGASINAVHGPKHEGCLHVWVQKTAQIFVSNDPDRTVEVLEYLVHRGADINSGTLQSRHSAIISTKHPKVTAFFLLHADFDLSTLPSITEIIGTETVDPLPDTVWNMFDLEDETFNNSLQDAMLRKLSLRYRTPDGPLANISSMLARLLEAVYDCLHNWSFHYSKYHDGHWKIATLLKLGADPNEMADIDNPTPRNLVAGIQSLTRLPYSRHYSGSKYLANYLIPVVDTILNTQGEAVIPLSSESLNTAASDGSTLLHAVCGVVPTTDVPRAEIVTVIRQLIEKGTRYDAVDGVGNLPLHYLNCHWTAVEAFLESVTKAASREAAAEMTTTERAEASTRRIIEKVCRRRNQQGQTPMFMWAATQMNTFADLIETIYPALLRVKWVDEGSLHIGDFSGVSLRSKILFLATSVEQFTKVMEMLSVLNLNDDELWTERTPSNGWTLLHRAIAEKRDNLVELLLEPHGRCDPTARDLQGITPLQLAMAEFGPSSRAVSKLQSAAAARTLFA
jgi:hypothetical protein